MGWGGVGWGGWIVDMKGGGEGSGVWGGNKGGSGSPVIILSASFLGLLRTATMRTIKIATKQTMSLVSRIYNETRQRND